MHEEVLRVLARLALPGPEGGQVVGQADDADVQEVERYLVHALSAGVVDVVEQVDFLCDLLQGVVLACGQLRRLAVQPADVPARPVDVQRVRRAGADDELLPLKVLLNGLLVVGVGRDEEGVVGPALQGLVVHLPEVSVTEDEILRLLPDPEEAQLSERLVDFPETAVVVVVDGVGGSGADAPALALLVLPGDVGVERHQTEAVAHLLRDAVAEQVELRLRELPALALLDGYDVRRLRCLDARTGLVRKLRPGAFEQVRRELRGDPFQRLRELQPLLPHHQRDGRVGLRVSAALVLKVPHAVLLEHGAGGLAVVAPEPEVPPPLEAHGALRVVVQDDGLAAVRGRVYLLGGYLVLAHLIRCL